MSAHVRLPFSKLYPFPGRFDRCLRCNRLYTPNLLLARSVDLASERLEHLCAMAITTDVGSWPPKHVLYERCLHSLRGQLRPFNSVPWLLDLGRSRRGRRSDVAVMLMLLNVLTSGVSPFTHRLHPLSPPPAFHPVLLNSGSQLRRCKFQLWAFYDPPILRRSSLHRVY